MLDVKGVLESSCVVVAARAPCIWPIRIPSIRTGLDSANPYNPVPEKGMAEEGNFLSESTSSAVGSRRSRAAAFGDKTSDDIFASAGRGRGRGALEVEGVLTSSSATTVGNGGEQYHMTPTS